LICEDEEDIRPGAQTERRGDAGPVRSLLGCAASPAALVVRARNDPSSRRARAGVRRRLTSTPPWRSRCCCHPNACWSGVSFPSGATGQRPCLSW